MALTKKKISSTVSKKNAMNDYNERRREGDVPDDGGAQLRDGVHSLATTGVCAEADWPYDVARFA